MRKQMKSAALSLVLTMLLCAFFGGTVQASDPVSPVRRRYASGNCGRV